ncbi:hypothetical protein APSETT445_002382 [Aspergillus pseudonomiae]
MLERYATSCPSGSWIDKLRRALNPSQQALAQTVATTREPPKLDFLTRLRWVASDEKKLTQLPKSREYTLDGNIPVVIEWRYYSSGTSPEDLAYLDLRVHMLAMQLKQSSALEGVNVLPCRGHFLDKANHRYGLVFQFPEGTHTSAPIALQVRLVEDLQAKPRVYRDYEDRLRAAHTLIITMYQLLCANWLHKNLTSENILIFEDSPHPFNLPVPHIGGFDFTRRDADLEITESFASHYKTAYASIEKRLYWHPDRNARIEQLV